MTKPRILIVDDEPDICEILRFNLEMEGYEVTTAESPIPLSAPLPQLILLDVMMTPKSGFEWAQELKANPSTAAIPIIFCTAKTMEQDLLQGFAIGSDDYICKPFRVSEVKARVKAVLNRCLHTSDQSRQEPHQPETSEHEIIYEGIRLDMDEKVCTVDGQEVPFTKLEFELLALLLTKPGKVFSREKILQTVWPGDTIVLDRTVDVNITRIRKKIGKYGKQIRTRFGYGYYFDA